MAYQSLYRKWRPQTFAAMVGQEHVARTLANAVREERMAHAYLFTGPRGTGKTSAARLFAKAINCPERVGSEPCDRCDSCVAIRDGRSLDVLEIDGASNRGIDEIRELRERVGMAATTGRFRFYIIDEVHQLTEAAFNALLKTLEEPPAHVIFILATTDAHKVPATISSRCQHFSFHRHSAAGTRARLKEVAAAEEITLEPAALEQLVQVADGSLRDALSVLDQAVAFCGPVISADQLTAMLGLVPQAAVVEFAGYLRDRAVAAAVQMPNRLAEEGADLRQFNQQLITHLRGLLAEQSGVRSAAVGQTWDLPHLLVTIRAFAAIDFSARLTAIPQLPVELAAVESCVLPAIATPSVAVTAPPRLSRPDTVAAVSERPAARSGGALPERNSAPASRSQAPEDDAILQAPAVVAVDVFDRHPVAAATVPDDLRRRWERTLVRLRPISSKAQGMCNSAQLLGIDGNMLVLSAKGIKFVMDSINEQRLRSTVEPVIEEIFGQKLGLRCELNGAPLVASASAPVTPVGAVAVAGAETKGSKSGAATKRPPTVTESSAGALQSAPDTAPPVRDLAAEAGNNLTVRMAMDAFGARIESVIPPEDSRRAG